MRPPLETSAIYVRALILSIVLAATIVAFGAPTSAAWTPSTTPSAGAAEYHQPCTDVFPFGEGNPWRVLDITPEEMTETLWAIDLDPNLTLFSIGAEAPGCWAIAFSDTSLAGSATERLLRVLQR